MIASEAAVTGLPRNAHYSMSKGAVLGLTRALASEADLAGISVNAVNTGAVTSMASAQARSRLAKGLGIDPSDERLEEVSAAVVSGLVLWLCHPECVANGEFFKAESGQVARLAYALAVGAPGRGLTPELARNDFDKIMDLRDSTTPPPWRSVAAS
jgi:NAD(P)-dependent dehydrogenase (short-subunit alcohol dehydrogenase family)